MKTHFFGTPDGGFQHAVWHQAYQLADLWDALAELDGVDGEGSPAAAMALAWEFAYTCQETVEYVSGSEVPGARRWKYNAVGQPTFVYLEEGDGTGWRLDSGDLGPDHDDRRLIALLVLRAPERGGMMHLWVRREDGVERLRSIRPTPGMVIAYRPGALLWEVGDVTEGAMVAIKVTFEARNVKGP